MSVRLIAASSALFVLAGLCEVGGDYLVWSWWRNGASWLAGLVGALVLILYGIVPTYQTTHFGRVYAAHGGRLRRPVPRVGLGRRWHPS